MLLDEISINHYAASMAESSDPVAQERYDRMILLGARTVFWTIPLYFIISLLFLHQPDYAYWSLGIAWAFASLSIIMMRRSYKHLARALVLAALIEAVSVLVLGGGPNSSHVGAMFPAIAGSAVLLNIRATIATAIWFCIVFAVSLALHHNGFYQVEPEFDAVSVFAQIFAVCAFVASVLFTYQRAVEKLTHQQQELARREAEARIQHEERLQLERRLRQSEKMEAFGNFAGGVAHDFNNLLTGVMGHAEIVQWTLRQDPGNLQDMVSSIDHLMETAQRGADITRQLLSFSRTDGGKLGDVDVTQIITEFEPTLRRLLPEDIELQAALDEDALYARLPLRAVEQVVMNLVTNARDSMVEGGTLRIDCMVANLVAGLETETGPLKSGEYVQLSVSDTGAGMSEEVLRRAFEPFFSTRRSGVGTGLGLSTVHGIVTRAGGGIAVKSAVGVGTTVTVYLPRIDEPELTQPTAKKSVAPVTGAERILVCEDEASILSVVRRTLEQHGYAVFGFNNPLAAIAAVEDGTVKPQLLLTDVVMPGMNGRILSEQLAARIEGLRVLYMSGHTDGILESRGVSREEFMLLPKPFTSKQLLSAVRQCIELAQTEVEKVSEHPGL